MNNHTLDIANQTSFTIASTQICKGIAIFLLLFHHLGLSPDLNVFPDNPKLMALTNLCKVCVGIFVFLSGYGLCASFSRIGNTKVKNIFLFVFRHLKKLYFTFWPIFIIFVLIGVIFGLRGLDIYGDNIPLNIFIDFMGLANLFNTPTYNITWWFMSLIILLYVVFPIVQILIKKVPMIIIVLAIGYCLFPFDLPFYPALGIYLPPFIFGIFFKEFSVFEHLDKLNRLAVTRIIFSVVAVIVCTYWRYKIPNILSDSFFAISIIYFGYSAVQRIPYINNFFVLVGKQSANIFMFHTFFFKYFFCDFFKSLLYWPVMYVVLFLSTFATSIVIEFIKSIVCRFCKSLVTKIHE